MFMTPTTKSSTLIDPNGGATTYTYNNLGEESTMILPGQTAPTTLYLR